MKTKYKLIAIATVVSICLFLVFMLSGSDSFVRGYSENIYQPYQSLRVSLFHYIPFSFGDLLYGLLAVGLIAWFLRWIYFLVRFRLHKEKLGQSILNFILFGAVLFLLFLIGWGGNYYKDTLPYSWKLKSFQSRKEDSVALVSFNKTLLDRLNTTAPKYNQIPLEDLNRLSIAWYTAFTNCKLRSDGLAIKSSLFGPILERLGIDGYYNPFTGEGQMSSKVPGFMRPFLVSHEMAHQAGIASEEDANLIAYVLGTLTDEPSFRYSAALNLWLYANASLYRKDSALALKFSTQLNPLTKSHIDTLRALAEKYNNAAADVSAGFYDKFLKMNHQKAGLGSYRNVLYSARMWEEKIRRSGRDVVRIP